MVCIYIYRYIYIRILHPDAKAQCKGDSRKHGLQDPSVYVVFGPLEQQVPDFRRTHVRIR